MTSIGISSAESLRKQGNWLIGYGGFLIVIGLLGYLSNPEAAKTALISGGTFGVLSIALGFGLRRAIGFLRWIALMVVGMLAGVFSWRSSVSWDAHFAGEPKLIAASLISAMLLASLVMIVRLLRG